MNLPISELIRSRWSPREFIPQKVDPNLLRELFEAARWAQSSFNEQPWRYLIAARDDRPLRQRLESLLIEGNAFAKDAWLLGVSYAKLTFARNQKPNRVAVHDVGAANQILALKAFDLGLNTRFMAGFDVAKAQELAPPDFAPVAMFAIGYATEKALRTGPGERGRKPLEEYVFTGSWGKPFTSGQSHLNAAHA